MQLLLGVENTGTDVNTTVALNAAKMKAGINEFIQLGLDTAEIRTRNFSIVPQYSHAPKNPPENWQAEIVGYKVHNTIEIKTGKLSLAGPLIDAAAKAGINQIQSINFSLKDETNARKEALEKAVLQARSYADAAAKAAGVVIKGLLELNLDQQFGNIQPRAYKAALFAQSAETPVSPDLIEVQASVTATYAIKAEKQ